MRGAEGVIRALTAHRKTADAAELAQRRHGISPPRDDLVRVGLMTHIPHQTVLRGVEHVMQRNGQFHRAQV